VRDDSPVEAPDWLDIGCRSPRKGKDLKGDTDRGSTNWTRHGWERDKKIQDGGEGKNMFFRYVKGPRRETSSL